MTSRTRVAIVTGAARGIGARTAAAFAERGFALALIDLDEPSETAATVTRAGNELLAFAGDVSSPTDVEAFARAVERRFGRADALVNNAGISLIAAAEATSDDEWRRVLDVNLTGPFLLCRAFGRMMLDAGSGAIVNVASIAGLRGISDRAAYNASKHGLIGLTRTLAAEWGGRGVRVNAVCPGWVKTEMDVADQSSGSYSDRDIVEQVPQGRFASADDVAAAIFFLADATVSGFVNGVALPVDGGWTADASWTSLRLRKR
jgi:NAD(P)-dependent dehydrogenase (short-subunit alcohol dehydrogenase family)